MGGQNKYIKYIQHGVITLTAVGAAGTAALDFVDWVQVSDTTLMEMTLFALGLLMGTWVIQAFNRDRQFEELERGIAGPKVEYLHMHRDVPKAFEKAADQSRVFIFETILNWTDEDDQEGRDGYRNKRDNCVIHRNLDLRQIVVFYHRQHFEEILGMLARFDGNKTYQVKHYEQSYLRRNTLSLSTLNVCYFDDEDVFIGSLLPPGRYGRTDEMLHVKDKYFSIWLLDYWNNLWSGSEAISLKEGITINHTELKMIAERFGISNQDYDQIWNELKARARWASWHNASLMPSDSSTSPHYCRFDRLLKWLRPADQQV